MQIPSPSPAHQATARSMMLLSTYRATAGLCGRCSSSTLAPGVTPHPVPAPPFTIGAVRQAVICRQAKPAAGNIPAELRYLSRELAAASPRPVVPCPANTPGACIQTRASHTSASSCLCAHPQVPPFQGFFRRPGKQYSMLGTMHSSGGQRQFHDNSVSHCLHVRRQQR
jgi:hypothetical protein